MSIVCRIGLHDWRYSQFSERFRKPNDEPNTHREQTWQVRRCIRCGLAHVTVIADVMLPGVPVAADCLAPDRGPLGL